MALSVSTDHLLHLCLFLLPTLISCEYSETSILVSIKEQLGGDLVPALSSWNPRSSPCDGWAGIKCSGAGRFVTGISLRKAGISTPIPPSICNLKYLTSLDVAHNNFMPNLFPTFLNRCANLRHLDFSNNRLSGPLPQSLCSQPALISILAFGNHISGEIPQSLERCSSLRNLKLSNNELTGVIPYGLWRLPNLNYLDLSNNHLSGRVPSQIGNPMLNYLNLSNNNLTGEIPPSLDNTAYSNSFLNTNMCTSSGTSSPLPKCSPSSGTTSNINYFSLKNVLIGLGVTTLIVIAVFFQKLERCILEFV